MAIQAQKFYDKVAATVQKQQRFEVLSNPYLKTKIALLAAAIINSGAAKAPFVSIAMRAKPIGVWVAICETTIWFSAELTWSIDIIEDLFSNVSFDDESHLTKNVVTALAAFIFALISQLPVAIPAAKYNPSWKYEAGVTVGVANAILVTRSLQLSLQGLGNCCKNPDEIWEDLVAMRNEMVTILEENLELFTNANMTRKKEFVRKLEAAGDADGEEKSTTEVANAFWQLIEAPPPVNFAELTDVAERTPLVAHATKKENPSAFRKVADKAALGFGVAITTLFECYVGYYTYVWTRDESGSWPAAAALSGISMAGYAYIFGTGVTSITRGAASYVMNRCTGNYKSTLAAQLVPSHTKIVKGLAFTVGAFATATTWIIWRDFFDETGVWPWSGREPMKWSAIINNVTTVGFMLFSTLLYAVDKHTENWLLYKEPEGRGKLIAYSKTIKEMIKLIQTAPPALLQAVTEEAGSESFFQRILGRSQKTVAHIEEVVGDDRI